ncbi:MAG: A/G-specific adenine glycosylase [Bacteroidetes bacterium QS_9_68_14]|nr:MAG: A/G-specific adenine glycosylase [Bacteroidetes bacterium QS_9_68_14]
MPAWYAEHRREMPWRGTADPYRIWVAEVMLQQTRVEQATPYFRRFVDAFPTVEALAEAERDAVLKRWEGLGYYARARHLHEAAQIVADEHGGDVPDTWDAIRELPGIGPYTAAAVLSIAFGKSHAVLDGNVVRLLARVFAVEKDPSKSGTRRRLRDAADALLADACDQGVAPGDFNQAVMELGATVCTPSAPRCPDCPVQDACAAYAEGAPEAYPHKRKKAPVPHHDVAVGLLENEAGELFIQRRPDEGLLAGLWEFPGGKQEGGEALAETCRRELREETGARVEVGRLFHRLNHAYSHFKITLHAFRCRLAEGSNAPTSAEGQPTRWVAPASLDDYAFPRANRRLIEELEERQERPTLFDAAER